MTDETSISPDRAHDVREEYDQIYEQPDPRAYFRILHGLDYCIPELASPVFRSVLDAATEARQRRLRVLDVGCGYGINAALLRYPLDMNRLAHRYRDLDTGELGSAGVVELDRNYFASWPKQIDHDYIGYDVSPQPVTYARAIHLIDDGFTRDLENEQLSADESKLVKNTDLIISTGCAGYVTEVTFDRIMAAIDGPSPWIAMFVLRTDPFEGLYTYFEGCGMRVEKLEGVTFIQRRFHSAAEWTQALMTLENRGISSEGKEADGLMHAEFYLIRPDADCEAHPLEHVISVSSGTGGTFGGWHGRPWGA